MALYPIISLRKKAQVVQETAVLPENRRKSPPSYLETLAKARLALLVPRFPRVKEWAYAGLVFIYTGAVVFHLAVGDPAVTLVAPIMFTALVAASWVLRPPGRRIP
jgi:DoxX-like family